MEEWECSSGDCVNEEHDMGKMCCLKCKYKEECYSSCSKEEGCKSMIRKQIKERNEI